MRIEIPNIDSELLYQQRQLLNEIIMNKTESGAHLEALIGIQNLLDAIQDYLCDPDDYFLIG